MQLSMQEWLFWGALSTLVTLLWWQWQVKTRALQAQSLSEQNAYYLTQQLVDSQQQSRQWQDKAEALQEHLNHQITALKIELAESNTLLQSERQQAEEKLALLETAKTALSHQFQALAGEILAQTGERLNQQQQLNLASLIDPFKEKLGEFKTRVEELHRLDTTERTRLSEQVNQLMQVSANVGDEAKALTRAMTGQAKSQGDWGELVLERLLELAGLIEGQQFRTQHSTHDNDGTRQRPDMLLLLPEDKHIIIDSKVSLTAYTRYVNASDDTDSQQALSEHIISVRNHITGLGRKNYPAGKDINSPDFVILFMPIEPALLTAAQHDATLYEFAWQQNVLLTSASTLLFVLRMVSQLWRNAQQQHSVQDIINRGEKLLDKFNGFAADLDKVGVQLNAAQKTWEEAKTKFDGRGGLLSQAHKLSQLGVKPSKPLPTQASWDEEEQTTEIIKIDITP
jgi:DNA recombination protein RmuC